MPTTRNCDFCGDDIEPGTGTMFVEINGAVTHFCSSKCEKNAGLGREARDHEWTATGQAATPEAQPTATEPAPDSGTTPETGTGTDTADEPEIPEDVQSTEPDDAEVSDVTPDLAAVEAETQADQVDGEAGGVTDEDAHNIDEETPAEEGIESDDSTDEEIEPTPSDDE